MPYEEGWLKTFDGLRLRTRTWVPAKGPSAVLVLVHGFTEHSGRYAHLGERLCQRGHAMCAIDLRGHGLSQGDRAWVRSFDDYLSDVEGFLGQVRERHPGKPLFVLGHSMGATIVVLLAIDRQLAVTGAIVSGAELKMPAHMFPVLRRLAGLVSPIWPRLRLVRLGMKGLSRDPRVVADFGSDPLNFHGRFTVRIGAEILRALRRIMARMEEVRVPLLILHGGADAVADLEGARELYARAASADKSLKIYDGLYHDLFHEPEKDLVLADLVEWLEARAASDRSDHGPSGWTPAATRL
jgi:alpha-beta hydrolase superfamily lysophospholipase